MQHDEIRELLPAFAVGAVAEDEGAEITRHVAGCAECTDRLKGYEAAGDALALSVEPVDLPAGFVERILAEAGAAGRSHPAPARRSWLPWAIAGAALVVATLVATVGVDIATRDAERKRDAIALLVSGRGVALRGEEGVIGRVVPSGSGSRLAVAGMGSAPQGEIYQLWFMRGEGCPSTDCEVVSAGTFDTEEGIALVELELDVGDFDEVAVTSEQGDGSDAPTEEPSIYSY